MRGQRRPNEGFYGAAVCVIEGFVVLGYLRLICDPFDSF